jgi:nuclear pore complex protein Nup155
MKIYLIVGFIIEQLEIRCFNLNLVNSPVPEALMRINLDIDFILDSYVKIVSSNERVWQSDEDELFLVRSVNQLLRLIVQNNFSPTKNR